MGVRKFLTGFVAFAFLIWGPVDEPWTGPALLIALPIAMWFALAWLWRAWQPDAAAEDRVERTIAGAIAGGLLAGAIAAAQSRSHWECTEQVRTRDGYECVGDYVRVPGPDRGRAFFLILVAGFAFWFGASARKPETPDQE